MIDRCHAEIAGIEAQLQAGHTDVEGLCLALADWSGSCACCGRALGFGHRAATFGPRWLRPRQADVWRQPGLAPLGRQKPPTRKL